MNRHISITRSRPDCPQRIPEPPRAGTGQSVLLLVSPAEPPDIEALLKAWGATVFKATSASQAAELAHARMYDLILFSLFEPMAGAADLVHSIRATAENGTQPIVVMTSEPVTAAELRRANANDVVPLPKTVRDLARLFWYWLRQDG